MLAPLKDPSAPADETAGEQAKQGAVEDMLDSHKVKSDLDKLTSNNWAESGPKNAKNSSSIGDLRKANELSKVSLNFGGSRSNLSSIVHLEEVSNGHYSIDKQEYRVQRRRGSQEDRS